MTKKVTLLDGAVGTSLWEYAGEAGIAKDPVWKYNIEHPELVTRLAKAFADAGAEYVLANTFGANGASVKRSSSYTVEQVVGTGVRLAKEALAGTGAKTVLAMGPLMQLMEPYGDLEEEEVADLYAEMLDAGVNAGAEAVMIQTFFDVEMMRVAATEAKKYGLPLFCTMSFEKTGKTMMGNSVQKIIDTLGPIGLSGIGMNCSLGPELALPVIREFAEKTDIPLVFKPNAGMPISNGPDGGASPYTPEMFVNEVRPALEFVSYIGGCCGCNPAYIEALKQAL